MPLTPATDTALRQQVLLLFYALEIILSGPRPLRLLDGSGALFFGGSTFTGRDEEFGTLGALELDGDGQGGEAPELTVTLLPPTNTARATLANPAMQGAQVSLWTGVVDPVTGLVVPEPDLLFLGEVDVPELTVSGDEVALTLRCVSVFERLFEVEEGARLTDAFHQSIWPGERGLEYVPTVDGHLPWGQDAPRPSTSIFTGAPGGTGGGTGGGRGTGNVLTDFLVPG